MPVPNRSYNFPFLQIAVLGAHVRQVLLRFVLGTRAAADVDAEVAHQLSVRAGLIPFDAPLGNV